MNVLVIFLIWRLVLFDLVPIAHALITFTSSFPYARSHLIDTLLPSAFWVFGNFDGVHYIRIAQEGYNAQFTEVFFPLFPLGVRIVATTLTKHLWGSEILAGLLISNICLLASLFVFKKLLLIDYRQSTAFWSPVFLLAFPFSFYFGAVYTEGFFMLLVLLSFYWARKRHWVLAGFAGAFATATKIVGILILPALLIEIVYQLRHKEFINLKQYIKTRNISAMLVWFMRLLRIILKNPIVYLVPIGLLSYMLYLQLRYNDFLYFWHVQGVFGAQRSSSTLIFPLQVLWRYGKILFTVPVTSYDFWVALWEAASFICAVFLLIIAHLKKIRLSYLIFSWFVILLPATTGTFSSMPRYILVAFPIYIVLAELFKGKSRIISLSISIYLLIVFTALYVSGWWVA